MNHFSKLVALYPSKDHSAISLATSLFQYCGTYGAFDTLMSDPGSDLMSEVISHLNRWFGIHHRVSLVDRHESNGVEGTNKQVLRHIKAIVFDERLAHQWSHPTVLKWVEYVLNSFVNSETGVSPYCATFGSFDEKYFKFPVNSDGNESLHKYVSQLDEYVSFQRNT